MSIVEAAPPVDQVGSWLDGEVRAGRLVLPLPPEKLATIAGIMLRPGREQGRRRSRKKTTSVPTPVVPKEVVADGSITDRSSAG